MNRLATTTSPYLQQHADNPVDWWPWCAEALALARTHDKPILLSIGYSACHWCHVMAHESFEDAATAEVMNELFINIKVDREERPDLDKIYQSAHQLLNQRAGGWPLTVILTPDQLIPFFVGTYFPKAARYNLPGFTDVLKSVAQFFLEHRTEIDEQNSSLVQTLADMTQTQMHHEKLSSLPLDQARRQLQQSFDWTYGGFGKAPKFPHPTQLERLLRHWYATDRQDSKALEMLHLSLHAMATGGLFDQLGGGFFRYSVDDEWNIPHFEKMLYDNGQLLALYSQAWQATGNITFRRVAEHTAEWVIREMQSAQGGYYSALDADSEGHEGKFYVWDRKQVRTLLGDEAYQIFAAHYGLDQTPNFEGQWHLRVQQSLETLAAGAAISVELATQQLLRSQGTLFRLREQRVHPGRDEKVLTSWNGLMIRGMAIAGRQLQRPDFIDSAARALNFIRESMFQNGRLFASHKDGVSHLMAYLDDYVFLADAVLELLQARWREGELNFAIALMDSVLEHFVDNSSGGFYFTADDHEQLFHRPKPFMDEAIPSGNGIAVQVLQRLAHLTGEIRYHTAAEVTLRAAYEQLMQYPQGHCALLTGLEESLSPVATLLIRGHHNLTEWLDTALCYPDPRRQCFAIPASAKDLPGLLAAPHTRTTTSAYYCSGNACEPALESIAALVTRLAGESAP